MSDRIKHLPPLPEMPNWTTTSTRPVPEYTPFNNAMRREMAIGWRWHSEPGYERNVFKDGRWQYTCWRSQREGWLTEWAWFILAMAVIGGLMVWGMLR
jgi:hypothetical protein